MGSALLCVPTPKMAKKKKHSLWDFTCKRPIVWARWDGLRGGLDGLPTVTVL